MVKAGSFAAEKYLLDSLNRIGKNPLGYSVLYVNVSKLKPKNRHPEFVKILPSCSTVWSAPPTG